MIGMRMRDDNDIDIALAEADLRQVREDPAAVRPHGLARARLHQIVPGLTTIAAAGHTPGMVSFLVYSGKRLPAGG